MTQATPFKGYHHITNSVTNPQPDVDFYTKVLGLRLIKRTVLLDGFGSEDTHVGITSLEWTPGGQLLLLEGVAKSTTVETIS